MKKQVKKALPFWISLLVIGLVFQIVFRLFPFPAWIIWLVSMSCWGAAALWMAMVLVFSRMAKPASSGSFTGNKAVYDRISREIKEAVSRYLESVTRKGLMKKSALYERPWFLVCGLEKSGKTQLLSGSGVNFPLKYPSDADGIVLSAEGRISWSFGNDAVFVDIPGRMMSEGQSEEWLAAVHAIRQIRADRAVDGVIAVVDAKKILQADIKGVKDTAGTLRKRLDELIAIWGLEFPVYLVVTRGDELDGFNDMFMDPAGKWGEQIFGATLSSPQQKAIPRNAFMEEYKELCASLRNMRLRILAKEKDEGKRLRICRFVIQFESLQEKLANFVSELFKPSSYEGKPVFRGFYFTSCQSIKQGETAPSPIKVDVGQTILHHPLNPHRGSVSEETGVVKGKKEQIHSYFTYSLFKEVIPAGEAFVARTQKFSRSQMIKQYSAAAAIAVVSLVLGYFAVSSAINSIRFTAEIGKELSLIQKGASSREEEYEHLGRMGDIMARLAHYKDRGVPFSMRLFYRGHAIYDALKKDYFARISKLVVFPAMKYLEFRIRDNSESFGELSAEAYNELYNCLKSYLSMSEAVTGKSDLIDTAAIHPVLFESLKNALLSTRRENRFSENIEIILNINISLYLRFLKNGEFKALQEDQRLTSNARKRLCRLPNAGVIYKSVIDRLSADAKEMTLDDLLGRSGAGVLQSEALISMLYTQEGWDNYVSAALKEESKNPYRIDWVLGTSQGQLSEEAIDKKELYQGMVNAYFEDVKNKWFLFISSVTMEPFGDLERSGRFLRKLGAEDSELVKLLKRVLEMAQIKTSKEIKPPAALSKALSKKTQKLKKLGIQTDSLVARTKGMDYLNELLEPYRTFVNSGQGAMGGLEGYRDKLLTLSEKLSAIQQLEGDNVVALFNGKESDPLFGAWTFIKNELTAMPEELAFALEKVLLPPVDFTAKAVSGALDKQLTALWNADVVTVFGNRLVGRYPFSKKEEEASFEDVMNFFRPATGIFWGFYERRLSPFCYKSNGQWQVRKIGTVEVQINPQLIKTLERAEKIRDVFFQSDGTQRIHKLSIVPDQTNKNKAVLKIGDREFTIDIVDKGDPAKFSWPVETKVKDVVLKVYANESVAKEFAYSSNWGLMRLFEEARINPLNQSMFTAKWKINVQNMYMLQFTIKVTVAASDNPFSEQIFSGFDCPLKITAGG